MPRVRWSATLEQDDVSSGSLTGRRVQKSSLKPPSMGPRRKSKSVVRKERHRRQQAKDDGAEAWRERGKLYRAKLIMKDEETGGDAFSLSNDCEIEKYYDVAERVLEQFLNTTVEDKAKLTEAYLVGNRLVKFVSRVLPTHTDYFSGDPKLVELRGQSQAQLVQLLQYLEELALIIDEEEYQEFVRENQELNMLSGEEAPLYEDSSDEVSSFGDEEPTSSFGEGPSFAASDAAVDESQDIEVIEAKPTQSRMRALQNEESKSWDRAFSDQIAPQLPELEPKSRQQEGKEQELFLDDTSFEVEWTFPADFSTSPNGKEQEAALPVDFSNSNTWPTREEHGASIGSDVWVAQDQREDPDSSFSSSPERHYKTPAKMTLRPKALYGSPSSSDREQSPKSVLELPELMSELQKGDDNDEDSAYPPTVFSSGSVDGYLQRFDVERPPPSDDGMSALSGEEEEASLTGAPMRRRRRMGHFKGCVRCLLE